MLIDAAARSHRSRLLGGFYCGAGVGRGPTAILLHGFTGPGLVEHWNALPSILTMNSELVPRRLLLSTGDRDELFPVSHYEPLAAKLESLRWEQVADADHAFSTNRKQLVNLTVD